MSGPRYPALYQINTCLADRVASRAGQARDVAHRGCHAL
jgi:hypothetical protein